MAAAHSTDEFHFAIGGARGIAIESTTRLKIGRDSEKISMGALSRSLSTHLITHYSFV